MSEEIRIDRRLHLVGHRCPMNFVYTKLKLEEMRDGEVLEVVVSTGEPARNVPRSVSAEGHIVLEQGPVGEHWRVLIRKRGDTPMGDGEDAIFDTQKVLLTVHGEDVNQPIVYTIGKQFDVIPNIQGASIIAGVGIVALELTGERSEIDRAIEFLKGKGIKVELLG